MSGGEKAEWISVDQAGPHFLVSMSITPKIDDLDRPPNQKRSPCSEARKPDCLLLWKPNGSPTD
jgi:hypothetical protein